MDSYVPLKFSPNTITDWRRCREDFPWFAARFCMIADKEKDKPTHLFLNHAQQKLLWNIHEYKNQFGGGSYLVLKARQEGVSTFSSNFFAHQAIKGPGFRAMQIAHEKGATENLLAMIKLTYNTLPEKISLGNGIEIKLKPTERASNRKELHLVFSDDESLSSRILIEEATAGGEAAISFSLNGIHYSEVGKRAFDDGKAIGASQQTLAKNAISIGEGTADGAYGWMYDTWMESEDDFERFLEFKKDHPHARYDGWVPIFLPWFLHYFISLQPDEVIVAEDEWEAAMMAGEGTYRHHRCTPENIKAMRWIMHARLPKTLEVPREQWRSQEYPSIPSEAFLVSGSSYFTPNEMIQHGLAWSREYQRTNSVITKRWTGSGFENHRGGKWQFIREPNPSAYKYVISGDCAEGLPWGDNDVVCLIEIHHDCRWVIGFWRDKEPAKIEHARMVDRLARWCKASSTAIELNQDGKSVNAFMEQMNTPGQYVQNAEDVGRFKGALEKRYGWLTSSGSRGQMLGLLHASLLKWFNPDNDTDSIPLIVPFPEIWEELRTFVRVNKKAEGAKGSRDDCVMALAIGNSVADDITPRKLKRDEPFESQQASRYKRAGLFSMGKFYEKLGREKDRIEKAKKNG